jgi:ATP-dependent RNA helicase DeaD
MSLVSSESNLNSKSESEILFRSLDLGEPILKAIEEAGYTSATPIQARSIPPLLEGRDVLGQAQTGTGKTAAFAIPMLQGIDPEKKTPQVLVLTPTRELAIQVADSFRRYSAGMPGIRIAAIYGGQDYQVQFRQLDRGVHIVVGTPGRVIDHINRSSLKLDGLRGLVLDEADEMLRMGFADDVEFILGRAPAERQIALFSATMPEPIRRIAQRHLRNPVEVTIKQAPTPTSVRQRFLVVAPHQKQDVLARILEAEDIDGVLIFVNTKSTTEPLAEYLSARGHRTAALSGDVVQAQRERIVENLRTGKLDVIIATDVAARGLDVQRISHVINYDLPFDTESYVHRIGRTGRASRTGDAILLVQPKGRFLLRRIEQATRQRIEPMEVPSAKDINERRMARFHGRITSALSRPEIETFASVVEQYRTKSDAPVERIAAALALLAVGDAPLFLNEDIEPIRFAEPRGRDVRARGGDRSQSDRRSFEPERRGGPSGRGPRGGGRMETFRIEVGRDHQVKPSNIVGAIANEAGLDSSCIGRIRIFDDFSTVDMLAGMPRELFESLKQVKVVGRRLNLSRFEEASSDDDWPAVAPSPAVTADRDSRSVDEAEGRGGRLDRPQHDETNALPGASHVASKRTSGPKHRQVRGAGSLLKAKGKLTGLRPGKKVKAKGARPKRFASKP